MWRLIPFGLKALRIDPALASAIMLTTVTDVVGFFSFSILQPRSRQFRPRCRLAKRPQHPDLQKRRHEARFTREDSVRCRVFLAAASLAEAGQPVFIAPAPCCYRFRFRRAVRPT
jgi:hypothetical protein